jgi:catechol 2,3-dioxygenase-like lactoylglutathione lyase family enzyme
MPGRRRGGRCAVEWKLEVVSVHITDGDRAKDFYAGKMGFNLDHDSRVGAQTRVVQMFD